MRIQLRCEHHFTTFYLKLDEVKGWLNIDPLPDESEEEFEKRAQEKVDAEFNRPEYNSLHKYERHKGFTKPYSGEDGEEADDYESCMSDVRDTGIFFKTVNQINASDEYMAVESFVYSILNRMLRIFLLLSVLGIWRLTKRLHPCLAVMLLKRRLIIKKPWIAWLTTLHRNLSGLRKS